MQWKYFALLFAFCISGFGAARDNALAEPFGQRLTVVLQGTASLDSRTLRAMESELHRVFRPSGTRIHMLSLDQTEHPVFDSEVIVVKVIGKCEVPAMPPLGVHRADTLGRTLVTDGRILPFVELDCRQISGAVRGEVIRKNPEQRPTYLGRALARVLAHEIYHVLAASWQHSPHGVACESLSAQDLTKDHLDFRLEDFESMGMFPMLGTN